MQQNRIHRPPQIVFTLVCSLLVAVGFGGVAVFAEEEGRLGPDVTVFELYSPDHYGSEGSIHAYAVGTVSCNQGDEPLNWCDEQNNGCAQGADVTDHPVIAQNLYRLKDGRFEQLGMSWLKHGFLSVNSSSSGCGDGSCEIPPEGGDQLGVGCTDPYGAGLNGSRPLGRRSTTNPSTGDHPVRPSSGGSGFIAERLQVEASEVDPALNAGAKYWVEGHYVAPDDATEGNGLNNASYRVASFQQDLDMVLSDSTMRERAAIYAWRAEDPLVEVLEIDIPSSSPIQRFHAARRVTESAGTYHYEYAIHNLNSDRGARLFRVQLDSAAAITAAGFRDVDHHSGEPYETTDWAITVDSPAGSVQWETDTFNIDEDANALRWGTTFTFWFDSDTPPDGATHTVELFKPGAPTEVEIGFIDGFPLFFDGFESGDTVVWDDTVVP